MIVKQSNSKYKSNFLFFSTQLHFIAPVTAVQQQ